LRMSTIMGWDLDFEFKQTLRDILFSEEKVKDFEALYGSPLELGVRFDDYGKIYFYYIEQSKTPVLYSNLFFHLMENAIDPKSSISILSGSLEGVLVKPIEINNTPVTLVKLGGRSGKATKTITDGIVFTKEAKMLHEYLRIVVEMKYPHLGTSGKDVKTKTQKGAKSSMKNTIMNKVGNKVENVFAMSMTGGFATKLGDDYYTVQDSQLTRVTDFIIGDFSMDGYTMPTTVSGVKVGDLISTESGHGIVLQIANSKEIKMITAGGTIVNYVPVKDFPMLPEAMVLTVMNPMGDQRATANPGQPAINPMMFMMMGKDKGDSDMFKMMAMSQMMGGQNPMAGMFGTPVQADTETVDFRAEGSE